MKPLIPKQALAILIDLGFVVEDGYVNVVSNFRHIDRKAYTMRHPRGIYLLQSAYSSWFYDLGMKKFVHPDKIHAHMEKFASAT